MQLKSVMRVSGENMQGRFNTNKNMITWTALIWRFWDKSYFEHVHEILTYLFRQKTNAS